MITEKDLIRTLRLVDYYEIDKPKNHGKHLEQLKQINITQWYKACNFFISKYSNDVINKAMVLPKRKTNIKEYLDAFKNHNKK